MRIAQALAAVAIENAALADMAITKRGWSDSGHRYCELRLISHRDGNLCNEETANSPVSK